VSFTIDYVGKSNEEVSSGEGIESIICPFLLVFLRWNILSLSGSIDLLCELEDIVSLVKVVPHSLSVIWITSSRKSLFTSIVIKGNTSGSKSESECALEEFLISISVKESCVIMVIDKNTESINIIEFAFFFSPSLGDPLH
jgi:hypothetical protein